MKIKNMLALLMLVPVLGVAQGFPSWFPNDGFDIGTIETIDGASRIGFDDRAFDLSPTVKVSSMSQKKADFSLVQTGITVGLKMITFNKKVYVDHIYILPNQANETDIK